MTHWTARTTRAYRAGMIAPENYIHNAPWLQTAPADAEKRQNMSLAGIYRQLGIATIVVLAAVLPFAVTFALALGSSWDPPHLVVVLTSFAVTALACGLAYFLFHLLQGRQLRRELRCLAVEIEEAEGSRETSAFDSAWDHAVRLLRAAPVDSVTRQVERVAALHPNIEAALARNPPQAGKGREPLIERNDPVLGKLRYRSDVLYWRGRVPFAPLDRKLAVDLGNDADGLFARQRGWYQELERRYASLQPEIRRTLQSDAPRAESLEELQLDRVNFPDHPTADVDFALGYTSRSTRWAYWVSLRDWKTVCAERVPKRSWKSEL